MKLYAFYTPSHEIFLNRWFAPTLIGRIELITDCYCQECKSANFMSKGWIDTMHHKVDTVLRGFAECDEDEIFIHSDVDIQFFGDIVPAIEEHMVDKDFMTQRDSSAGWRWGCAGFFACRVNKHTKRLWSTVKRQLGVVKDNKGRPVHDQHLMNVYLYNSKVRNGYFPPSFFGPGLKQGPGSEWIWSPGMDLDVPDPILMHHANWSIGIDHKIAQLEYVRNIVRGRNGNDS